MTICINQEVEEMEDRKENIKNKQNMKKGTSPNIANNDLKSEMKKKIKSKRGQ